MIFVFFSESSVGFFLSGLMGDSCFEFGKKPEMITGEIAAPTNVVYGGISVLSKFC